MLTTIPGAVLRRNGSLGFVKLLAVRLADQPPPSVFEYPTQQPATMDAMNTRLIVIRATMAGAIALEVFGDRWIAPMRMTREERSVCETEPTAEED